MFWPLVTMPFLSLYIAGRILIQKTPWIPWRLRSCNFEASRGILVMSPKIYSLSWLTLSFLSSSPFKPPPPVDHWTNHPLQWVALELKLQTTWKASLSPPCPVGCCVVVVLSRQLKKPPFAHPPYTRQCSFQALSSNTTCLSGFLLSRWFDILVVFFLGIVVIIIVVLVVRLFFVIFNFVGLWKTILYWWHLGHCPQDGCSCDGGGGGGDWPGAAMTAAAAAVRSWCGARNKVLPRTTRQTNKAQQESVVCLSSPSCSRASLLLPAWCVSVRLSLVVYLLLRWYRQRLHFDSTHQSVSLLSPEFIYYLWSLVVSSRYLVIYLGYGTALACWYCGVPGMMFFFSHKFFCDVCFSYSIYH